MQHQDHVALIAPGIPRTGGTWADLGAGRGAFTLALAECLTPAGIIYAVDIDGRALSVQAEALKQRYPQVQAHHITADFTQPMPLPTLDGMVMANALHFIPDAQKAAVLQHIRSYLKPAGRLILIEYNVDQGNRWVPHPISFKTWQRLAPEAGFSSPQRLGTRSSSFLRGFYSALCTNTA